MKKMTTGNTAALLKRFSKKLSDSGVDDPQFEAELLVETVCSISKTDILLKNPVVSKNELLRLEELVDKRCCGEPLQYLLGEWEFYSLPFYVGKGVLIPRADTEILVDTGLHFLRSHNFPIEPRVIDLCSGSGAVAVAVKKNFLKCEMIAVEKYDAAFGFLTRNIQRNECDIKAVFGDIEKPEGYFAENENFDLILSNPPYIDKVAMSTLQREVTHEPENALVGGDDGLYFYRVIVDKWVPKLKSGGCIAVEIGFDQRQTVSELFKEAGLRNIECITDYGGRDRVIVGTMSENCG